MLFFKRWEETSGPSRIKSLGSCVPSLKVLKTRENVDGTHSKHYSPIQIGLDWVFRGMSVMFTPTHTHISVIKKNLSCGQQQKKMTAGRASFLAGIVFSMIPDVLRHVVI